MSIIGQMEEYIKDNGKITKCMESAIINGQMVDLIKVNMWMTKNKVVVNTLGRMEDIMMVIGRTENNMEEVNMYYLMVR